MTEQPEEHEIAQPDGEDVSADELVGTETTPDHDAEPDGFADDSDDDGSAERG